MTDLEPFDLIKQIRADVAEPRHTAENRARNDLQRAIAGSRASKRPKWLLAAGGIATTCLVLALAFGAFSGRTEPAAAAELARLVDVAANQRAIDAKGRNQYVLSRWQSTTTLTLNATQPRLDELTANVVAVIDAQNENPPTMVRGNVPGRTEAQWRRSERLAARAQQRFEQRARRGVRADELPAQTVTATSTTKMAFWLNDRGLGAGGGLPGGTDPVYGTAEQKQSAKILEGVGIVLADSVGFDVIQRLSTFALPAAAVKSLSENPSTLRDQLNQNPPRQIDRQEFAQPGSALYLFEVGANLLSSPYASPALRSATLEMLSREPEVTATTTATDGKGRSGLGLTIAVNGGSEQIVLDRASSRVLGVNFLIADGDEFQGEQRYGGPKGPLMAAKYDTGVIQVSYEPSIVTRGEPVCVSEEAGERAETYCESEIREITSP